MDKNSLWSAMIDMNIGDDVTLGGCYRQYFKDTQYEILSSTSQSTFYVFKNVTVPASISNCSYRGNGILDEVYGSYGGALNYIQEEIKNKMIRECELALLEDNIKKDITSSINISVISVEFSRKKPKVIFKSI